MDKIGDLLNRIATANPNSLEISVPNSKYKRAILKVLYEEGWIAGITEKSDSSDLSNIEKPSKELLIFLKRPYIDASNVNWANLNFKVSRISKPGRRIYYTATDLKKMISKVTNIACTILISTNKGVMTINKAVDLNLGGELLFKVSALG